MSHTNPLTRLGEVSPAPPGGGLPTAWKALICLIGALCCAYGWAQESTPDLTRLTLEDLMKVEVYSASKELELATNAPSSVTIVTSDEIRKYGYRTLADVLRSVRGFFVTNDRNYSYLGTRGFARGGDYNDRILLLLDGHRINDALYDGALIGAEFPLDLDLIERVEIVRGPSSSLYGTSAFFGVINVITRKASALPRVSVSEESGSFGSYKGRVAFATDAHSPVQALVSSSFYASAGHHRLLFPEYADAVENFGLAVNADDEEAKDVFADVKYRNFDVRAVYGTREKGIPTGAYDTKFNDPRTRTTDSQGYIDLGYKHQVSDWELSGHVSYNHYGYDGTYVYPVDGGTVINRDFGTGDWWGGEFQAKRPLGDRHRLTFGSELRDNVRRNQKNYDLDPFFVYLDDHHDSRDWGIYAQDVFEVRHNLTLHAGVRHDRSLFGGTTNPRFALIYKPLEKTTVKLLFGQAFRAPNAYELFYGDQQTQKGNLDLLPERIRTYEITVDHYLGTHVRVGGSAYRYDIKDLIVQQDDPNDGMLVFRNAERIRAYGLEGEIEGRWSNGMQTRWSYAAQNARNQQSNTSLIDSPKHLAKANLTVPLLKRRLFAGLEAQYISKRRTLQGADVAGAFVANASLLHQNLFKGLDLSASVYNLFDRRYADPASVEHRQVGIPQDGRAFRLKLSYGF